MTILTPDSLARQSITAFSNAPGATSGILQNELADCAASLRDTVGRVSKPQPAHRPFRRERFVADPTAPIIIREVVARVNDLLALQHNWDSYGGRPVSRMAANAALLWLDEMTEPDVPVPSVVPGSDGSIQLEWHARGIDFEVLFSPSCAPEFVYEDHNTGTVDDGLLSPQNQHGRIFVQQLAACAD